MATIGRSDQPLAQRRGRIAHVAEQIREREPVERLVLEGQLLRRPFQELDGRRQAAACLGEHLRALVEPDHRAGLLSQQLAGDRPRPCRHVEDGVARPGVQAGHEEAAPARILAEGQQRRVTIVRRPEWREERPRGDGLCHEAEFMLAQWR